MNGGEGCATGMRVGTSPCIDCHAVLRAGAYRLSRVIIAKVMLLSTSVIKRSILGEAHLTSFIPSHLGTSSCGKYDVARKGSNPF